MSEAELEWQKRAVKAAMLGEHVAVGVACPTCWRPLDDNHAKGECEYGTPDLSAEIMEAHGLTLRVLRPHEDAMPKGAVG